MSPNENPLAALYERLATPNYPVMISLPVGWTELVLQLDSDLSVILPDYTIAQVKEKFAGLRYYIDSYGVANTDPRVELSKELISEAETVSMRTCQVCGSPGRYREEVVWQATLCDEHAEPNRR